MSVLDRRSFFTGIVAGAASVGGGIWAAASRHSPGVDDRQGARVCYADLGEDLALSRLLRDAMRVERPTYLDIGAADPIEANNTYLLYSQGGHGVLVEPNPAYQARLRRCRPRDVTVGAGVGVGDATEADYYVIRNAPMRNTFSKDDVEHLVRTRGRDVVERVVKVPLVSINHLIARHLGAPPDLLSTDVEGLDFAILRTLDFEKYRPAVIVAETQPAGPIPSLLASQGYEVRGVTMNNVIFADPGRYAKTLVSSQRP